MARPWVSTKPMTTSVDDDVGAAVDKAANALSERGAKVSEASVPATIYGLSAYYLIAPAEASSNLARYDGVHYGYRAPTYANLIDMYSRSRGEGFGKEVKRREEAAQAYADAGRAESADRENREAAILRAYLPAGLSAEQLEAELRRVIEDVQPSGPGGFGQVMKEASRRLAGRAEGGEIAGVARRLLAEA